MKSKIIKCLIIDDDPFIQELLKDKLNQFFPELSVLGTASSGQEGLSLVEKYNPELLFLDVEMADMTGFELLSKIKQINFQTIFITSYSHYAIKAIRFNALDYLLKPIDLGELKRAIKNYRKRVEKNNLNNNVQYALQNLKAKKASDQSLVLQTQEGELRLLLKNIIRVEGERNYSYFYLINNKRKLTSKTIGDIEELLNDKGFFRCHKSHLVNLTHIDSNRKNQFIQLSSGDTIPIARRRKDAFNSWFNSYSD